MDRARVRLEQRHQLLGLLRLQRAQLLEPLATALVTLVDAPGGGIGDGLENGAGVADETEGHVAVLADGAVVQVDLHDGRVRAQALAVAHAEVEGRADDDDDIGLVEGVASRAVEVVRVARGQYAAARTVEVGRDVQHAHQFHGRLVPAAAPHLGPQENGGTLGRHQDVRQALDVGGIADGLR